MNIPPKKLIAGLAIYEILLTAFVLVFEPYGMRMSSSEWTNFWTWFFIIPIAAFLIHFLINWASGKNTKTIKIKTKNKNFKYFTEAITKKYIEFRGRASIREYWMFFLFSFIFGIVAVILDMMTGLWSQRSAIGFFSGVGSLFILIPTLAITARRFHDINKSGWFQLIFIIPIIGTIAWLIWMCTDGNKGKNQYGKPTSS